MNLLSCWTRPVGTLVSDDFIVVEHDPAIIQYCPLCMKEMTTEHVECVWCQKNVGDRICISSWLKRSSTCPTCHHAVTVYEQEW